MITTKSFQAMGLHEVRLEIGAPAHLVILGQDNLVDILRYHQAPRHVISHGKLVDNDKMTSLARLNP